MDAVSEEKTPFPTTRSRWIMVAVALQIITLAALVFVYVSSKKTTPEATIIAPVETRDDKAISLLQTTIDELNLRIKTLEQKPNEPSPAKEIDALHQSIASLEEQIATQSGHQSALVQQLLAFDQMKAAIIQGRPYDTALSAFIASGVWVSELQALKMHQHKGIASDDDLKHEFNAALTHYFHPASKDRGVWQRLSSLITIRKVGDNHSGNDAQSIIARAESAMNENKLDTAQEEIRSLSDNDQAAFSLWLKRTATHQKIMRTLESIKQSLSAATEPAHE